MYSSIINIQSVARGPYRYSTVSNVPKISTSCVYADLDYYAKKRVVRRFGRYTWTVRRTNGSSLPPDRGKPTKAQVHTRTVC